MNSPNHGIREMKIRNFLWIAPALVVLTFVTGFSLADVGEYATVARNDVKQAIQDATPTDVEIKRLKLSNRVLVPSKRLNPWCELGACSF